MRSLLIAAALLFSVPSLATKLDYPQSGAEISSDGNMIARLSIKSNSSSIQNPSSGGATMSIFRWDENVGYVPISQYTLPYLYGPKNFVVGENGHVMTYGISLPEEKGPSLAVFNISGDQLSAYTLDELFPKNSLKSKIENYDGLPVWLCINAHSVISVDSIGIRHQFGYFLVDLQDGTFEAFYEQTNNCDN